MADRDPFVGAPAWQRQAGGPNWPLRAATGAHEWGDIRGALRSRGALSWYAGGGFSLLWLLAPSPELVKEAAGPVSAVLGITTLVVYAAAFLVAAPIAWALPGRLRLLAPAVLFALSFALVPWFGWGVRGTWTYVGVVLGMCVLSWRPTLTIVLGLGGLAFLFGVPIARGGAPDLFVPAIIVSISLMMAAFARTLAAMNELHATQQQMELMAAERERSRVARDIHDILGHSLTVITVKSELAGRLVDLDPEAAKREIGEVEQLGRAALVDVRSTVAGFRAVGVGGELVAARVALQAAGIEAELPGSADAIDESHRELAGWVVREGVTNVVRHAQATVCRVRLGRDEVEVADDGVGPADAASTSTGLAGLRERAEAAGGRMTVGRSDLGGFSLRVRW